MNGTNTTILIFHPYEESKSCQIKKKNEKDGSIKVVYKLFYKEYTNLILTRIIKQMRRTNNVNSSKIYISTRGVYSLHDSYGITNFIMSLLFYNQNDETLVSIDGMNFPERNDNYDVTIKIEKKIKFYFKNCTNKETIINACNNYEEIMIENSIDESGAQVESKGE